MSYQYPEDLLKGLKSRDIKAAKYLHHNWYPRLFNYAKSITHDEGESEDIVIQIIFKVWENPDSFADVQHLERSLVTYTKNKALNFLKYKQTRQDHQKQVIAHFHLMESATSEFEQEIVQKIYMIVNELPTELGLAFEMRFIDGLEVEEIAQKLNKKPSTIYNQCKRAIQIIRERLGANFIVFIIWMHSG